MKNVLVKLENVTKKFNNTTVIKNINLDIYEGEFLTLLGPSGCGKTTILRMISGLEHVTEGKVYIDNIDVTNLDPTKRQVNTVFQNFALFPHMTTYDNVAFGLRMQKANPKEIEKRVSKIIKLVKLEGFEDRLPSELSGGQQQRVAIARGVVMNPKVLLLDESLCSLDLKLKRNMQIELKKIQKKLGITFVYVTHDQNEALTMSDRIAIINNGIIEQLATPQEIYRKPKSSFVADFIGDSNIIEGRIISRTKNNMVVETSHYNFTLNNDTEYDINEKICILIRPETIEVSKEKIDNSQKGKIIEMTYNGDMTKLIIELENYNLKATITDSEKFNEQDEVYIHIDKKFLIPIKRKL